MKTIAFALTSALCVLFLTGCLTEDEVFPGRSVFSVDPTVKKPKPNTPQQEGSRFGFRGEENGALDASNQQRASRDQLGTMTVSEQSADGTMIVDGAETPEGPVVEGNEVAEQTAPPVEEKPAPPKKKEPAPSSNIPYADPIPGQSGYVYSPFAPGRPVVVTGFSPGQIVECPYTQKKFRVP
ncbi:MAG: hypothetical protein AAGA58_04620 [Verrucomicrobiota bacterium]